MKIISQIDVLVHPDFYQMGCPELPLHPRQIELRQKWDERIQLIMEDDVILFYFSNIPHDELEKAMHGEVLENKIKQVDVERIRRYKKLLDERFFFFSKEALPDSQALNGLLQRRGMTYSKETRIVPYGEAYETCVSAWGWHIKEELSLPDESYDFSTEKMCLTFADTHEINRWRENAKETRTKA